MAKKQDAVPEAAPETEALALEPKAEAEPVVEAQSKPEAVAPEAEAKVAKSVTLASYYGFYDEGGNGHFWSEGQIVTEPADIELLLERDAPLKD